ncbi:hypothetical protein BDV06DRAFT_189732 [Aspergillus oleicola]
MLSSAGILFTIVVILAFIIYRNTTSCRRRIVKAANREMKQTWRAYKPAARKLRWQQFYKKLIGTATLDSDDAQYHELQLLTEGSTQESLYSEVLPSNEDYYDGLNSRNAEGIGLMQTDVAGFRQTLAYVGQQVQYQALRELVQDAILASETAPRRVDQAGDSDLSTAMPLRTFSLGIRTETPPPSYHP